MCVCRCMGCSRCVELVASRAGTVEGAQCHSQKTKKIPRDRPGVRYVNNGKCVVRLRCAGHSRKSKARGARREPLAEGGEDLPRGRLCVLYVNGRCLGCLGCVEPCRRRNRAGNVCSEALTSERARVATLGIAGVLTPDAYACRSKKQEDGRSRRPRRATGPSFPARHAQRAPNSPAHADQVVS